jgi:hypothetical protein
MKMRKTIPMIVAVLTLILLIVSPIMANSSEDYEAIRKATKSGKDECLTVFKILVTDKKAKKVKVKLTLPITLVNWIGDHCHGRIDLGDGCHLNLRSIVKKLKRGEPFSILEIDDGEETVKIWFE